MTQAVVEGIAAGALLAAVVSAVSIAALRWAGRKSFYMWVWAGGMFFRLGFLVLAAWAVHRFTDLHLAATLITMVIASTALLVAEAHFCSKG